MVPRCVKVAAETELCAKAPACPEAIGRATAAKRSVPPVRDPGLPLPFARASNPLRYVRAPTSFPEILCAVRMALPYSRF